MQSSLRQLVTGSERATRLVNQLLLLARAENPAAIGLARTDLNAIAYEQAMHWVPHALSLSTDLASRAPRRRSRSTATRCCWPSC